jgi:putative glutamine amidotransferase
VSNRPLIGVTGPNRGGFTAWVMTALAIRRAGGRPVRIRTARLFPEDQLHGVVIGGGTDVDPLHYGEEPIPEEDRDARSSALDWLVGLSLSLFRIVFARHEPENYDPERDQLEQHMIRHALYHDLPVLGICRGAQLLNVTLGGSLHQRIDHFYAEGSSNVRSILPRKQVTLAQGSRLHRVLGSDLAMVNALHEQCVKDTGDGVIVSAVEQPSGVIQGIEKLGSTFVVGVQWHPEYLPQHSSQQALFRALVASAAGAD